MDIEAILEMYEDDYNPSSTVPGPRNMYNQGQLVQPNADGSRPGYSGLGGNKIPKYVLNKGAQYFYKVDYDNLKDDKELTKEKKS